MNLEGKKAIITGISKGIGKELTQQLLEKGAHVMGWGMSEPAYSHEHLQFIKTDVRERKAIDAAAEETLNNWGTPDILVNNAGLGYFGFLEEMPLEQIDQMLLTNVHGLIHATRTVLPAMKEAGKGHILNLSSIAGLEGMPQVAVYCATKYAVRGFTEALFRELRDHGIKVTGIYPGSVQTNFFDNTQGLDAHDGMLQPQEVAMQLVHLLETSDNFITNQLVIRPLQPKKKK